MGRMMEMSKRRPVGRREAVFEKFITTLDGGPWN